MTRRRQPLRVSALKPEPRQLLSADEIESRLAEVKKSATQAGYLSNADAVDRVRRLLTGQISLDAAQAEILAKYIDAGED